MTRIVQESHANLICAEQPIMIDNARGIGYAITRKRRSFASMLQYYGRPGRLYKEKIDSPKDQVRLALVGMTKPE